jgi:anti-sigma28 factor (negative regulator of flagellin synthesis)
LSAPPCGDIRLAPGTCTETRLLDLRTAVAEGRYRIDSQAIAARLIAAIDPQLPSTGTH